MSTAYKAVVVEDDNDLRFLYKYKFEVDGFTVLAAANGAEGLEFIERLRPDIVLLDLLMPVMGGAEMLTLLRSKEWGSNIRVIILTNISKSEAPAALRFYNVDRYVVKAHHTPGQVVAIAREVLKNGAADRPAI